MAKKTNNQNEKLNVSKADFSKYDKLVKKVESLLQALRSDEKAEFDSASLDAKLAKKLEAKDPELAEKIAHAKNTANVKRSWYKHPLSIIFGTASFSLMGVLFVSVLVTYFMLFSRDDVPHLANLRDSTPIPPISLEASSYTSSGFVAASNEFTLEVEGGISSDLADSFKFEPDVEFEAEQLSESDGTVTYVVKPVGDLAKDTEYTLSLVEGTEFENGAKSVKPIEWTYLVDPQFAVISTIPENNASEVPIDATVEITLNHRNVSVENFRKSVGIYPEIPFEVERFGNRFILLPQKNFSVNTSYEVTVDSALVNDEGDELGEAVTINFKTGIRDSSGKYYDTKTFYLENVSEYYVENTPGLVRLSVNSSPFDTNDSRSFRYRIYKVDKDFVVSTVINNEDVTRVPEGAKLIDEVSAQEQFSYRLTADGFYLIEVYSGVTKSAKYALVSRSDLAVMHADQDGADRGWVYSVESEKSLRDVSVTSYIDGEKVEEFKTDAEGAYTFEASAEVYLFEKGSDVSILRNGQGENMYWGGITGSSPDQAARLQFDRTLYRPGDTVYFKGYVAQSDGDGSLTPANLDSVKISSGYSWFNYSDESSRIPSLIDREMDVDTSNGTFEGFFKIPLNTSAGYKSLSITNPADSSYLGYAEFEVSNFELPSVEFDITYNKQYVVEGEQIVATIQAKNYAGQPLANSTVKVDQFSQHISRVAKDYYGEFSFKYFEPIKTSTVRLDEAGIATYAFNPRISGDVTTNFGIAGISVGLLDESASTSEAEASVLVSQASYNLLVDDKIERLVEGDKVDISLRSRDAIDTDRVVGSKTFNIDVVRTYSVEIEDGVIYDPETNSTKPYVRREERNITVYDEQVTTDEKGNASIALSNLGYGSYEMIVSNSDLAFEENIFYVTEKRFSTRDSSQAFPDVSMSKYTYEVGEQASVIMSSYVDMQVYLFINGHDIINRQEISLKKGETVKYTFDVRDDMYPFVRACVVGFIPARDDFNEKTMRSGCSIASVESDKGVIDVSISTDKEAYAPGETVKLEVQATQDGKPTDAEVALAVVDQAIVDISDEGTTALSLRNELYTTLVNSAGVIENMHDPIFIGGTGAGGEGDDSANLRDSFKSTADWTPRIQTGDDGVAIYEFVLPDNLTTWNIKALGVTSDMEFGDAEGKVRVSKKQFVSVNTPSYIRVAETSAINVDVSNLQGEKLVGNLRVTCENCKEESVRREIEVAPKSSARLYFPVSPVSGSDIEVIVEGLDQEGKVFDAVRMPINVLMAGSPYTDLEIYTNGPEADTNSFEIDLPAEFDLESTAVNLSLSSTLGTSGLQNKVSPSTRSTEAMSAAIMQRVAYMSSIGEVDSAEMQREIYGYFEIMTLNQNLNGGYGEFETDGSDIYSSWMAAQALTSMHDVGFEVESDVLNGLQIYLEGILRNSEEPIENKVMALNAYAHISPRDVVALVNTASIAEMLADAKRSDSAVMAGLAMDMYSQIGMSGRAYGYIEVLEGLAEIEADGEYIHWTAVEGELPGGVQVPEVWNTAYIYNALSSVEAWHLTYGARNWLVRNYGQGGVQQASELAYISYLLADAEAQNYLSDSGTVSVKIIFNDEEVGDFKIDLSQPNASREISIDSELLKGGSNSIEVITDRDIPYVLEVQKYLITEEQIVSGQLEDVKAGLVYRDIDTKEVVDSRELVSGEVYLAEITVSTKSDLGGVEVRHIIPSGMRQLDPRTSNISGLIDADYYRDYLYTWGFYQSLNLDYTSGVVYFTDAKSSRDSYTLVYPMVAEHSGVYPSDIIYIYSVEQPEKNMTVDLGQLVIK